MSPSVETARSAPSLSSMMRSRISRRVSAFTPGTIRFLTELGVWRDVAGAAPFDAMEVWDARGTASLDLPAKGVIVENARVESALHAATDVDWGRRVTSVNKVADGFDLELDDGMTLSPLLLIGADGAASRVRKAAGLRTIGWRYDQQAVVANVLTENPHHQVARQVFTPSGPLAFLPLADAHTSSIVWSSTEADTFMAASDEEACEKLNESFEGRLGEVRAISRRVMFPLQQQHALSYVATGLALVGDAAHAIHPLAGQGANLGLQDARCLAKVLASARLEGRSPGDAGVLRAYQRERQPHNVAVAGVMESLKRVFQVENPGFALVRNTGMKLLGGNDWLKDRLVAIASQ